MPSLTPQPRHRRYTVRWQARLDAEAHAKLQELAQDFHRKRAQILRHVMPWALARTHAWTVAQSSPAAVQTGPTPPGSSSLLVSRSGIVGYRGKISDYGSYTADAYHCLAPTIWRCPPHRGHYGAAIDTAPADGDGANCRLPPLCHVVIVRP
jgi:hypothetical protein